MNLITEITSKVAKLPPAQQREALAIIEKLAKQQKSQNAVQDERHNLPPLKGATAKLGKRSISAEEIAEARREMWGSFYNE